MKRLLATALALVLLFIPTAQAKPSLLESVRPLQIQVEEVTITRNAGMVVKTIEKLVANICTVSNINEKQRYWLTAAHCVDDRDLVYWVAGERAIVVMRDVLNDLAILQTPTQTAKALDLAGKGPKVEDHVAVAGYPFGYPDPFITLGTVANTSTQFTDEGEFARPFAIFEVSIAPGSSGSPVVNRKGDLISVVQIGWGRGWSSVAGGATFDVLERYQSYFEDD